MIVWLCIETLDVCIEFS